MVCVGICGLGSIGRRFLRMALETDDIRVAAVNDVAPLDVMAYLLKYDSTYGTCRREVRTADRALLIDGQPIAYLQERSPDQIDWRAHAVDIVLECTGRFTCPEDAAGHLQGGARRVVISAPAKGPGARTVILGVNADDYDPQQDRVVSMGSCTTNCLLPVLAVLQTDFGVLDAMMTTIHSYTNDQNLLDAPHKDLRRARAAGVNIIPTSTGAQRAVGQVWPDLAERFGGLSLRVPTPAVSVVDVVVRLERTGSPVEINEALRTAAEGPLHGIMDYTDQPLVSADLRGSTASATVDGLSTASAGSLCKVLAWYDNEWGYAARLLDLVRLLARRD